MIIEKGSSFIKIKPDYIFAKTLIESVINNSGMFFLPDDIISSLNGSSLTNETVFYYKGIYPNHIKDTVEASKAFESLNDFFNKAKKEYDFKLGSLDDLLFITYLFQKYQGEEYSRNENNKYLDELIDVYFSLSQRIINSSGDIVWLPNGIDANETAIEREHLTEEELKLNGGYKSYSFMIGTENTLEHVSNDSRLCVSKRHDQEEDILLPERLSRNLIDQIIKHIIDLHRNQNTQFYTDLVNGDFSKIKLEDYKATRKRKEKFNNILYKLITEIQKYITDKNAIKISKRKLNIFTYKFLKVSSVFDESHQRTDNEKSTFIRDILKNNPS